MDQNRLEQLAQEFETYLRERRVFGSAWTNGIILEVEINWGDWKHEHLRCNWLMEEFLESQGLRLLHHTCEVTEEDGSDCYSGIHKYLIGENSHGSEQA